MAQGSVVAAYGDGCQRTGTEAEAGQVRCLKSSTWAVGTWHKKSQVGCLNPRATSARRVLNSATSSHCRA
jgi:hypothetical protein